MFTYRERLFITPNSGSSAHSSQFLVYLYIKGLEYSSYKCLNNQMIDCCVDVCKNDCNYNYKSVLCQLVKIILHIARSLV